MHESSHAAGSHRAQQTADTGRTATHSTGSANAVRSQIYINIKYKQQDRAQSVTESSSIRANAHRGTFSFMKTRQFLP